MQFLRKRLNERTEAWWHNAELERDRAPGIVRELLDGDRSVVGEDLEIEEAMRFARELPGWNEAYPALVISEASTLDQPPAPGSQARDPDPGRPPRRGPSR
jgi:hypothetical protein